MEHLSLIEPTITARRRQIVAPISAEIAAQLLAERLSSTNTSSTNSNGLHDLVDSLYSARQSEAADIKAGIQGAGRFSVEAVAGLLAALPDRVSAFSSQPSLQPSSFIPYTIQTLIRYQRVENTISSDKTAATEVGTLLAAELVSRFSKRGHSRIVASALWGLTIKNQADHPQQHGNDVAHVLAVFSDASGMEKVLEALLQTLPSHIPDPTNTSNTSTAEEQREQRGSELLTAILPISTWTQRSDASFFLTDKVLLHRVLPQTSLTALLRYLGEIANAIAGATAASPATATANVLVDTAWRLSEVWGSKPAIQRLPVSQQAYITAALVGCLHLLRKDEFEGHSKLMPAVLKGISNRLESPMLPIRR